METQNVDNPIRIAEVVGNAATGGVINFLMNFYRHIDKSKVQFDFYMYDSSPFDDEIRALGGRVFTYPNVVKHPFKAISALKKAFKREKYSIVHVHMTTLSFVALFAAQCAGVKHRICHAHSTASKAEGWKYVVKNLFRPISRLFATELAGCSELSIKWLYGHSSKKAKLIHNAIDLERFGEACRLSALEDNRDGRSKTIGFIGRFEKQKNVEYLVDVFADIGAKREDVKLLLVGEGSRYDSIAVKIKECGLEGRVVVKDWCKNVEKYYSMIDVLALPSLFEGLPMVAIEAQAAGIPCVLSDNVTKEAEVSELCKFLSLERKEDWAQTLSDLLDEDCNSQKDVLTGGDYDIRVEAERLLQYYVNIMGKGVKK